MRHERRRHRDLSDGSSRGIGQRARAPGASGAAPPGSELEPFFRQLYAEIERDQEVVRELIALFDASERPAKKAAAWLGEKVARLKLAVTGSESEALRLFESLEMMALGVWGKREMWVALAELAPSDPRLAGRDFAAFQARAEDQFARLERRRLEVAPAAFGDEAERSD